ncbi:hypothetical protein EAF04_009305 [Stromatinia cepivora]|nr:hypothetical protein EAF04_009305 [Stromatinia cepivora]
MAGLSKALPISTTIDNRNAAPEVEGGGDGSLIGLTVPITIGLPPVCLGVAVCNPVTVGEDNN